MTDIKALRLRLGLSQQALAQKLGVSLNTIRLWEYGFYKPNPEHQERVDQIVQHVNQEEK